MSWDDLELKNNLFSSFTHQ